MLCFIGFCFMVLVLNECDQKGFSESYHLEKILKYFLIKPAISYYPIKRTDAAFIDKLLLVLG